MPNRRLTDEERTLLRALAADDSELHGGRAESSTRKRCNDERMKPMQRRALKTFKRKEQDNR